MSPLHIQVWMLHFAPQQYNHMVKLVLPVLSCRRRFTLRPDYGVFWWSGWS